MTPYYVWIGWTSKGRGKPMIFRRVNAIQRVRINDMLDRAWRAGLEDASFYKILRCPDRWEERIRSAERRCEGTVNSIRCLRLNDIERGCFMNVMRDLAMELARIPGTTLQDESVKELLKLLNGENERTNMSTHQRKEILSLLRGKNYCEVSEMIKIAENMMYV